MRKRLIIGAIGITAFFFAAAIHWVSFPSQGSVDYHLEEYAAWQNDRFWWMVQPFPSFVERAYLAQREKQLEFHGKALEKAGVTNVVAVLRD